MTSSIEATPVTPAQQHRNAYADGLRALAALIDGNRADTLPLPYAGSDYDRITFHFLGGEDPRGAMAAAARAIPITWRKVPKEYDDGTAYLYLQGELHGLKLELVAYREAVCERVVTGTREVTETVKDPDALAAVPEIEVTKTVEDVRWECHSILAPSAPAQVEDAA